MDELTNETAAIIKRQITSDITHQTCGGFIAHSSPPENISVAHSVICMPCKHLFLLMASPRTALCVTLLALRYKTFFTEQTWGYFVSNQASFSPLYRMSSCLCLLYDMLASSFDGQFTASFSLRFYSAVMKSIHPLCASWNHLTPHDSPQTSHVCAFLTY